MIKHVNDQQVLRRDSMVFFALIEPVRSPGQLSKVTKVKQRGTSVSYLIKDTISTKRGNYEKKK